jgi:hypothetical protein
MKPITVILLIIGGSLLLLVGAFAIFFARGGEVLYWVKEDTSVRGCQMVAEESVAQEIAKMDFTFSPIPELTVQFQGIKSWHPTRDGKGTALVGCSVSLTGRKLRAFPTRREYQGISGEEFEKQLTREIQSRLPDESEFSFLPDYGIRLDFQEYPKKTTERP